MIEGRLCGTIHEGAERAQGGVGGGLEERGRSTLTGPSMPWGPSTDTEMPGTSGTARAWVLFPKSTHILILKPPA